MLADEQESAQVYRELASRRDGEEREVLLGLSAAEECHAAYWEHAGGSRWAGQTVDAAAGRAGPAVRLGIRAGAHEQAERRVSGTTYTDAPASMAADELIQREVVRGLAAWSGIAKDRTWFGQRFSTGTLVIEAGFELSSSD